MTNEGSLLKISRAMRDFFDFVTRKYTRKAVLKRSKTPTS